MTVKQFLIKYWYISASITGILSGFAVIVFGGGGYVQGIEMSRLIELFIPGVIFGIFSASYFFFFILPRPALWRLFLWVIASFLSYLLAFGGALAVRDSVKEACDFSGTCVIGSIAIFGISGLIGVSVLIIAFKLLFQRLQRWDVIGLLLVGGLIPIVPSVIFDINSSFSHLLILLFISWQTAVMLVFGHQIYSATKEQASPAPLQQ